MSRRRIHWHPPGSTKQKARCGAWHGTARVTRHKTQVTCRRCLRFIAEATVQTIAVRGRPVRVLCHDGTSERGALIDGKPDGVKVCRRDDGELTLIPWNRVARVLFLDKQSQPSAGEPMATAIDPTTLLARYRDDQAASDQISLVTKALALYMRSLVDPVHGWLELRGHTIVQAIRNHSTAPATAADRRILRARIDQLVDGGHLVQCSIGLADLGVITSQAGQRVALSPWLENPRGDWVVITNWIPSQYRLDPSDTVAWHKARQEQMTATMAAHQASA